MTRALVAFGASAESRLLWQELPEPLRSALERKLEGLYGGKSDETVFDALAVDKQRALLILARRFLELKLWAAVRRIENLYGEGGVGMHFIAWPFLRSTLAGRKDFSSLFAGHHKTTGGFIERGAGSVALHLLYRDDKERRSWEAHFDLYNPWSSPLNAWRHLLREKVRGETPGWRAIGHALGYWKDPTSSGD
jgi:hypothetical protein